VPLGLENTAHQLLEFYSTAVIWPYKNKVTAKQAVGILNSQQHKCRAVGGNLLLKPHKHYNFLTSSRLTLALKNLLFIIVVTFLFQSCSSSASFTDKELRWFRPFQHVDTCIFISENGLSDTIIFQGADTLTAKMRNLEQGFRDEKTLQVKYILTKDSYHQFVFPSKNTEPENFVSVTDNDNWTKPMLELSFLGSIYDNSFFDKVKQNNNKVVHFDAANSIYRGVNIAEGIKSFDFDFDKGVISFTDKFNRKWWLKD
jgi:hypothetical protein